ncbi:IclR family transcriptional regulator [Acidipila rosea]|uniref:IclR family transcriptional regulator n=1 Tax=Acidipila rosea TaxID=768535 RepID=A0A4R1LA52_9BACT|nr:IclR family transcriptional regulator [Acidipila rosea]MBW4043858.1 IclR family transcriptional regulator [Acidobacteriota bacterium]TCK74160.1 IclR family transcriptional regulator [Acidipila rosea]
MDRERVKPQKKLYPTPALEKGLDILELFAREPGGLTKSDVARRLGRTVSEIFRMLLCLEERGYISQSEGDDRFRLTLRLFRMALEYPPAKRLASEAIPVMQEVAHEIRQSCHLGVLEGGQVVILSQVDSPVSPHFYVKAGSIVDPTHSATGHAILAYLPEESRAHALALWQNKAGQRLPKDLEKHLAKIRAQGYEERVSYEIRGITDLSFPIFDEYGAAVAGLTVPCLARIGQPMNMASVREVLRNASMRLTEKIGGVPPAK